MQELLTSHTKDITLALQRRALEETADFVQSAMPATPTFQSRTALLDSAIAATPKFENGLVLEFGVWRGATISHLAKCFHSKVYGFDSFEGLPHDWRSGFPQGHFKTDSLPSVPDNVELIKGWFDETLPPFLDGARGKVRLLHIDCDLYSSTATIFQLLEDRICPGTVIVFDEFFNYPGWKFGEFQAFNEFIERTASKFEFLGYCSNDEQVAVKML